MLTEKSTERKSQPQMKKKGTALLAGYFGLLGSIAKISALLNTQSNIGSRDPTSHHPVSRAAP
jgi:hypothetical protein